MAFQPRIGTRRRSGGIGQPVGGGTLGEIPDDYTAALQGKSSNERAAIEQKRQKYARELKAQGFNSAVANSASRIMAVRKDQKVSRPMSVLGAGMRALGVIENVGAGFAAGITQAATGDWRTAGKQPREYLGQGKGFGEFIKEEVDPKDSTSVGRFIRDHAGPVGFGMALLFDPTMYMSFGATSASKQVAYRAIANSYKESSKTARQLIETTGGKYKGQKFDDLEDLTLEIHKDAGRPITLHQSLVQQRELGLEAKSAARRGKIMEISPEGELVPSTAGPLKTARKTAAAWALPTNVRGGAGTRFAGMEIPGTPGLGEAMGRSVRATKAGRAAAHEGGTQRMFVTNFRQKLIADDLTRALALAKMSDFQTAMRRARVESEKLAATTVRAHTGVEEGVGEIAERPALRVTPEAKTAIDDVWTRLEEIPEFDIDYFEDLHVNLGRAMNPKNPMQLGDDEFTEAIADSPGRFFQRLGGLHEYSRSLAQGPKELDEIDELFERVYDNLDTPVPKNVVKSLAGPPARVADDVFRAMEEDLGPGVIKASHTPEEPLGRVADPEQVVTEYTARANREAAEAAARAPKGKPQMIPLQERLAVEAPLKLYRGDMEEGIVRYDIEETSALGAMGQGLYATPSEDIARAYSDATWVDGLAEEEISEGFKGEVKRIDVPREYAEKSLNVEEALPDNARGAMRRAINQELKTQEDPNIRSDLQKGLAELEKPEATAQSVADEMMDPTTSRRFAQTQPEVQKALRDELMKEGYVGYKIPTAGLGYAEDADLIAQKAAIPDYEYSFWNNEDFNKLVQGTHELQQKAGAKMLAEVDQRVADEMAAAKEMGLSSRATREMWERIKKENPDPAVALANFVWRNQSMVLSRRFLDDMLNEPMFAKAIEKDVLETELPKGQKAFAHPKTGQRYSVLGEIADALDDFANPVVIDKGTSEALRIMNMPQNFWKQYATLPNPSFHAMNMVGAIWNNLLGGVYNPGDYVRAIATVYKAKVQRESERGGRVLGRRAQSTPGTRAASEMVEEAEVRGALGSVSIFAELGQGDQMIRDISVPPTVQERLKSLAVRRPDESKKRYATRQSRRGLAVGLAATGNPLALAAMAPELVQVGRRASSAMEDVVRMAPFMKASKDPTLRQYLHAYGPVTVPGNRHPDFSKEMQAAMYDIAASNVKQFQFDYTDLTDFERRWAKTIFPFYTFYRKNFVLQAQMLVEKPRYTVGALTTINYLNENSDVPEAMREMLPDYFENIQAVAIPVPAPFREKMGLPQDVPLFLNPKLPFLSLNLMPPVWDIFRDTGQPTKQKVLAAFAPMLGSVGPWAPMPVPGMKMILEASVGEQLGLNKTIDYQRAQSNDWRNSWVPAPPLVKFLPQPIKDFMGVFPWGDVEETETGETMMTATGLYFMEQMSTPFVNNLGQTIPVGGPGYEGQKARADLVSWMTGVRLIPVDPLRMHRSWAYRLKSMLESQKADLEDKGERMEPEDQRSLKMVRRQLKVLERSWDRQQQELYGRETRR